MMMNDAHKFIVREWWNSRVLLEAPVVDFRDKANRGILQSEYDFFEVNDKLEIALEILHRDFFRWCEQKKYEPIYNELNFKHACINAGCFGYNKVNRREVMLIGDEGVAYKVRRMFVNVTNRALVAQNKKEIV